MKLHTEDYISIFLGILTIISVLNYWGDTYNYSVRGGDKHETIERFQENYEYYIPTYEI